MATSNPGGLEATDATEKRAQWENLRLAPVTGHGYINVCNVSHGVQAKAEHTYSVRVEDGQPVECGCKADEHQPGACKHRVACMNDSNAIAEAEEQVATDGGRECDHIANDPDDCLLCELQAKYDSDDEPDPDAEASGSEAPDFNRGPSGVDEL